MKKQLVDPTREEALKILRRTENSLSFPKLLVTGHEETAESKRSRALVYQLVMGTLRYRETLDWALNRKSASPITDFSSWIRNILRMGLFQILYLDRIPKFAAVNESVNLAKKYGHAGAAGLVNAILRNCDREEILQAINALPEDNSAGISIKYSHPQWMVELLIQDWGLERTLGILKDNNAIPPVTARVNTLRTDRDHLINELQASGVVVSPVRLLNEAIEFSAEGSPARLPAHKQGLFYLQDVSSMFAAHSLDVQPGQTVLDACAGPGGKSTHLAALMKNQGKIFALDVHDHRLALVRENSKRLGAQIIEARKQDATGELAPSFGNMDRVLVDAPCSGLGVIRRRIDLKWRLRPERIKELVNLQTAILERASECVRPRGLLVYCTCTIVKQENNDVVRQFLRRHPQFQLEPEPPKPLEKYLLDEGFTQILPGDDNMDGFFIARIRRL